MPRTEAVKSASADGIAGQNFPRGLPGWRL